MIPYAHQQKIIDLNPRYHLLALECGTGKTGVAITLAPKHAAKTLVVCPISVSENWVEEIKQWYGIPAGDEWKIVTKEEFKRDWKKLAEEGYKGLIVDEAHYFGGYQSAMFKCMVKYLKKAKPDCVYLLTATPYMSTPFNIFCLEVMLGRPARWIDYAKDFFYETYMGDRKVRVIKSDAKERLAKIVAEIGSTVRRQDCLDLPPQIYLQEYFNLHAEQKKAIADLRENALCSTPIIFWTKRHQISGGTLRPPEDPKAVTYCKSNKTQRTVDICHENAKTVVVCRYRAEQHLIASKLKKPYVMLNGGIPKQDRYKLITEADKAKEMVFLVTSACSEGYNLTGFDTMVFYSNGFSFKDREQMEGRIHRIGQKNKCVYIDLITLNNVDQDVIDCLKNKKDFSVEIYAAGRKR